MLQKKIYSLLVKRSNSSPHELGDLQMGLKNSFFRPLLTSIDLSGIVPYLVPVQCQYQKCLFSEGDKIEDYYFISEGSFSLYRGFKSPRQQLWVFKNSPSIVGEYFIHNNTNRAHTAICTDKNGGRGFKINIQIFSSLFSILIQEYAQLKSYLCSYIGIHCQVLNKIQVINHAKYERYPYNFRFHPEKTIYIIIKGECLIIRKQQINQPIIPQMTLTLRYKQVPLVKLCENDCINLDAYYNQPTNHIYQVTSQEIILLAIPFESIKHYPNQLENKFKAIHLMHKSQSQQNTKYLEKPIAVNKNSNILQKCKTNISVNLGEIDSIRKKYCLGFNSNQKIQRESKDSENSKLPQFFKEKKINKYKQNILQKRQWKQYLKLPPLFNDIKLLNQKTTNTQILN